MTTPTNATYAFVGQNAQVRTTETPTTLDFEFDPSLAIRNMRAIMIYLVFGSCILSIAFVITIENAPPFSPIQFYFFFGLLFVLWTIRIVLGFRKHYKQCFWKVSIDKQTHLLTITRSPDTTGITPPSPPQSWKLELFHVPGSLLGKIRQDFELLTARIDQQPHRIPLYSSFEPDFDDVLASLQALSQSPPIETTATKKVSNTGLVALDDPQTNIPHQSQ